MKIFLDKIKDKMVNNFGFTIIEVIIVMAILTTGMLGVSSLVVQNLKIQNSTRDTFIASMLAQDGLEIIRNIRDENWLILANDWDRDIGDWPSDTFIVDYRGRTFINPTIDSVSDVGAKLYRDADGFYSHDNTGEETAFSRIIEAVNVNADAISVSVTIGWNYRESVKRYEIKTVLFDWK